MQSGIYIDSLKLKKIRISPGRKRIVEIFCETSSPLTADFLTKRTKLNKTSVYRELLFLIQQNLIVEVDLADGSKRYELKDMNHHHHLVCLKCKKVSDVNINDRFEVPTFIKKIQDEKGFTVLKHNLEFFGYCQSCTKC